MSRKKYRIYLNERRGIFEVFVPSTLGKDPDWIDPRAFVSAHALKSKREADDLADELNQAIPPVARRIVTLRNLRTIFGEPEPRSHDDFDDVPEEIFTDLA